MVLTDFFSAINLTIVFLLFANIHIQCLNETVTDESLCYMYSILIRMNDQLLTIYIIFQCYSITVESFTFA